MSPGCSWLVVTARSPSRQSIAQIGQQRCVAAVASYGKGKVMAVGCGSLWNDLNMGETWMTEPSDEVRTRYEALYRLLRLLVEDKPAAASPPQQVPEPKEQPIEAPGAEL
jgi:hypothetical protein